MSKLNLIKLLLVLGIFAGCEAPKEDDGTALPKPVDNAPILKNAIPDINTTNSTYQYDINSTFEDPDGDTITYEIQLISNTNLLDVNISGTTVNLNFKVNQSGQSDITIRALSNQLSVDETFRVFYSDNDIAPVVSNTISNIDINSTGYSYDITNTFTDADNNDSLITKTIHDLSNPSLLNLSLNNNILIFDLNGSGETNVTIRATSNAKIVDEIFTVTLLDHAPIAINTISNIDMNSTGYSYDITNTFTDADNNDSLITKTIHDISNPSLLNLSLNNNILIFDLNGSGETNVTIRAASNAKTVDEIFTVTLLDYAPVVINEIPDINASEVNFTYDISNVFSDADNNDSLITKVILLNTNENLNVEINGTSLIFDLNTSGEANITIRATSNNKTIDDTFALMLSESITSTDDLHILSSSYDKNDTTDTADDKLFIIFSKQIEFGSVYARVSDNFEINGTGSIGSTSSRGLDPTMYNIFTVYLNNAGTQSVEFDTNNTYISIVGNTITDTNGNFANPNNLQIKVEKVNFLKNIPTTNRVFNTNVFGVDAHSLAFEAGKDNGLIWQREDDNVLRTYDEGIIYCENLVLATKTNWRLPTLKELISITEKTQFNPSTYAIFANTNSLFYYSKDINTKFSQSIWGIDFYKGSISTANKTSQNLIRCVHD